jgi:hypothetical protein
MTDRRRQPLILPLLMVAAFMAGSMVAGCQRQPHPPAAPPQARDPAGPPIAQRRAEEARWLAAFPTIGTRDGSTLILRHGNDEIGRYTDDRQGCNPYSISKVIRLYDAASGQLQPVAEITCRFGALDNRYLVLPTSTKYTVRDDVDAAPDGRMLAMADNALGPTDGDFTLIEWPSLVRFAGFKVGCRHVTWHDPTHLHAVCWHNDGSSPQDPDDSRTVFFTADITKAADATWTMTATGFVDSATEKPVPAAGRPLPHFVAEVPAPDRP